MAGNYKIVDRRVKGSLAVPYTKPKGSRLPGIVHQMLLGIKQVVTQPDQFPIWRCLQGMLYKDAQIIGRFDTPCFILLSYRTRECMASLNSDSFYLDT